MINVPITCCSLQLPGGKRAAFVYSLCLPVVGRRWISSEDEYLIFINVHNGSIYGLNVTSAIHRGTVISNPWDASCSFNEFNIQQRGQKCCCVSFSILNSRFHLLPSTWYSEKGTHTHTHTVESSEALDWEILSGELKSKSFHLASVLRFNFVLQRDTEVLG